MTITPEQRANAHEALDQALNHDAVVFISFHPAYQGDGALLRRQLEQEFGAGTYHTDPEDDSFWVTWGESFPLRLTVHDGSQYLKERPLLDRTQVDPIEGGAPVTVATTPHSRYGTDAGIE